MSDWELGILVDSLDPTILQIEEDCVLQDGSTVVVKATKAEHWRESLYRDFEFVPQPPRRRHVSERKGRIVSGFCTYDRLFLKSVSSERYYEIDARHIKSIRREPVPRVRRIADISIDDVLPDE